MDYLRIGADGELPRGVHMSFNDRIKNWDTNEKIIDYMHKGHVSRLDKEKSRNEFGYEIPKFNLRTKTKDERLKSSKCRKRNKVNSNLKTISKPLTARDASESRSELKRFRKPSDRLRRQLRDQRWKDVRYPETTKGFDTSSSCMRKDSSDEGMVEMKHVKNSPRKAKKKIVEKGDKSTGPTEKESSKEFGRKLPPRKQKTKKSGEDVYYRLPLGELFEEQVKELNELPGKAVVIYQRENKRKCLNPQTGDGLQYEQISFADRCDMAQSKRSLSEPRRNSLNSIKDLYVARRRTRFHMEPIKPSSTCSDFQSTMSLLKEYRTSSEYQKFSDNVESSKCIMLCYRPLTENERESKAFQVFRDSMVVRSSQKTVTDREEVSARLKETAKKKLNLHREMIRAEKKNKKKFWESIQRSLNYRCALAEMLSSTPSFLSNEPSKGPSSRNETTGQSTSENVSPQNRAVKNISSYQSPKNPEDPKTSCKTEAKVKIRSSPPSVMGSHQIPRILSQPRMVSEDQLQEKIIAAQYLDNISWVPSSQSTNVQMAHLSSDNLRGTTTLGKWNLLESSADFSTKPSSELESLMAKLSQEIRRCSNFIKELNSSEQIDAEEKPTNCLSCKVSVSDSKLNVMKGSEWRKGMFSESGKSEEVMKTIMLYRLTECVKEKSKKNYGKVGTKNSVKDNTAEVKPSRKKELKGKKREKGTVKAKLAIRRIASNASYSSLRESSSTSSSISPKSVARNENKEVVCCDYCRFLRKRIFKLEKDLERIEKILPFYPVEYQDSLKDCLGRLRTASDCVLKKLKTCANSKHEEHQKEASKMMMRLDDSRSSSAPIWKDQSKTLETLSPKSCTCEHKVSLGQESIGVTTEPMNGVSEEKAVQSDPPDPPEACVVKMEVEKEPLPTVVVGDNYSCSPTADTRDKKVSDTASSNPFLDLLSPIVEVKEPKPNFSEIPTQTNDSSLVRLEKNGSTSSQKTEITDSSFLLELQIGGSASSQKTDSISSRKTEITNLSRGQSFREETKCTERAGDCQSLSTPLPEASDSIKAIEQAQSKTQETEASSLFSGSGNCVENEKEEEEMRKPKTSEKKERPKRSRIPTRRKATPYGSPLKTDSVSLRSSKGSLSKSEKNSLKFEDSLLAKLFSFTWTFGFFLCKLVHYMQSVSAICSVLTLTAMSLERYYAIVHPMKAQYICTISQARRIITGTWISAFLLAVPILFAQVHLRVGVKVEAYWCVRDWDNKTIWRAHELYMMLLILVVPTGVMAVAYTAICWEIWEVIQRRQDMTSGKGHGVCRKPRLTRSSSSESFPAAAYTNNNTKLNGKKRGRGLLKREDDGASVKQVIKMLVAVVIIYVLCWGPMLIDNVLQAYGILNHIRMGWLKYMGTAFHLMAYFNSCINPIIYGFMSKNFRESFMKALCCGGRKPKTALRNFSLSQTRNTSIRYAESSFGRTVSIALPV